MKSQRYQTGHIFKRCSHWYLRYSDLVRSDDGQIVRKQFSKQLCPVSDEFPKSVREQLAREFLAPLNATVANADHPSPTMAVADFIRDVYLPEAGKELRQGSFDNYSDIFRLHVKTRLQDDRGREILLRKFRTVTAQKLLDDVALRDKVFPQRLSTESQPLSHSQLKSIKAFLSSVFKCAKRLGYFDGENPLRDVKVPRGTPEKTTYAYSPAEVQKFISIFGEPTRTVITLMGRVALRKGECEGLRWGDYDGESLSINRSIWHGLTQAPKTPASKAPVRVAPELRVVLDAHRKRLGEFAGPDFPILQSEIHTPLCLANVAKRIIIPRLTRCMECGKPKRRHKPEGHLFRRDASLPEWRGWHAFGRGWRRRVNDMGESNKTIQAVLRHSNVRTTMDYYVKHVDKTVSDAMDRWSEKLSQNSACTVRAPDQKESVN